MPFEMSEKSLVAEELLEATCLMDRILESLDPAMDLIRQNEVMDRQNDRARSSVFKFLLSALNNMKREDYGGANNDVHAALQKLNEQEMIDLQDDKPRTDALIKLSALREKTIHTKARILKLQKALGLKPEGNHARE